MTALTIYLCISLFLVAVACWICFADEEERRSFDRETGLEFLPDPDRIRYVLMLMIAPALPLLFAQALLRCLLEVMRGEDE